MNSFISSKRPLIILGHRGVGKTTFLERLKKYQPQLQIEDLDQRIVKERGKSIDEIFTQEGEETFRQIEGEELQAWWNESKGRSTPQAIALGGGYLGALPEKALKLWLRRSTDHKGRVFFDRPRLNSEVDLLQEFLERIPERDRRYRRQCDFVHFLPEGIKGQDHEERQLFGEGAKNLGGILTLIQDHFQNGEEAFAELCQFYIEMGIAHFEVRDDWVKGEALDWCLKYIPEERRLFSYRQKESDWGLYKKVSATYWDWPLELGEKPQQTPPILSLHERMPGESFEQALLRLTETAKRLGSSYLKAALLADNYEELSIGHRWFLEDPKTRSFLPRSKSGRWNWYRAWRGAGMKVNFFQEGRFNLGAPEAGWMADQPSLMAWMKAKTKEKQRFAAVLGTPVAHSYTPIEHQEFFSSLEAPVFAIDLSEAEWDAGIETLKEMGLFAAAVTSPLKKKAYELCGENVSELACELEAVNTLFLSQGSWRGTNTDLNGVEALKKEMSEVEKDIVIWGGGGTLTTVTKVFPQARSYSARTGRDRDEQKNEPDPNAVIWSVGRSRMKDCQWPPENWRPEYLVDLNYSEDSPGREYAARVGAKYVSGEVMFRAQASAQRDFWSGLL